MTAYRFYTATTVDGFIADEHDSLDWLLSQPEPSGGILDYDRFIAGIGAVVMGYTTYQWVLGHPEAQGDGPSPWPYEQPTFVFTHRELDPAASNIRLLSGAPEAHREMLEAAADGRDVWIVGGGDLAAQFADAGMVDEIDVSIAPVTLGAGRPLFKGRYDLELEEFGRSGAFLEARYRVAGRRQ
ncbi:dihydrofolate reductase family protein [Brachybacterium sp. GCM10030268]|uniref:dihydrofolate reductase family protein n=1 Tax=Brachybacterium sp. GCM10030268 TaxID=3273382 RepID=UPI00361EBDED